MNTEFNTASETLDAQRPAPAPVSATRVLYWSLRREFWENRSIYIVPLVAAAVFLFGFVVHTIILRHRMHGAWTFDPEQQYHVLTGPYEVAAALIMGTAFLVGVIYSLDALYGERRDRSILFWKSLPVSDLITVLSKMTVPLVIIPLLSFVITIVAQLMMLLTLSTVLLGSGVSEALLWTHSTFLHVSAMLLYHLMTVHGLWYAPMYGWLLLVSAWAPRAPYLWAVLPPFVIYGVEKIAFNTSYFLAMLWQRVTGPEAPTHAGSSFMEAVSAITPAQFFSSPGLWVGLAIAAVFVAGAVRMRRYRGPI